MLLIAFIIYYFMQSICRINNSLNLFVPLSKIIFQLIFFYTKVNFEKNIHLHKSAYKNT